MDHTT